MARRAAPPARALGLAGAGVAALVASRGFGTPALAILGVGLVALPVLVTRARLGRRAPACGWSGASSRRAAWPGAAVQLRRGASAAGPPRLGLDRLLDVAVDPGLGDGGRRRAGPPGGVVDASRRVRGDHRLPPAARS